MFRSPFPLIVRIAAILAVLGVFVGVPLASAQSLVGERRSSAAYAGSGHVIFELGEAPDASVIADALSLADSFAPAGTLDRGGKKPIRIKHLGKGRTLDRGANEDGSGDEGRFDPEDQRRDDPSADSDMVAFNGKSENEFLIQADTGTLGDLAAEAERAGLNRETEGPRQPPSPTGPNFPLNRAIGLDLLSAIVPGQGLDSWSNDDDDRYRVYGLNAAVTSNTYRRLVQLGSGCSGTLVGPRHVVTAGHCLWSRTNQAWSDNFTVASGRNGTSFVSSVFVDKDNIPGGQALWYFTPAAFRNPNVSSSKPYDFGVLVLPARIGEATGWLGWWTLNGATLQANAVKHAGYPKCSATSGGVARIDPPSPCSPNHLYANAANCELGEFANQKDGWSRTFNHSCDASAGDSGSSLFLNYNGQGNGVTGIHTTSLCEKTPTDVACTGDLDDRPLMATRITPEYAGWISYFRNQYP